LKVVINSCFGGFHLSIAAIRRLYELKDPHLQIISIREYHGIDNPNMKDFNVKYGYIDSKGNVNMKKLKEDDKFHGRFVDGDNYILDEHHWSHKDARACPLLVKIVKELGEKANSSSVSKLKIVTIPDGIDWEVTEYDGSECVEEKHRSWS